MLKEIVNLGLLYQKHGLAIVFNIEASSCVLKDNTQVGSKVGLSSLVQKRFDIVFEEIARKVSESLFPQEAIVLLSHSFHAMEISSSSSPWT